MGAFTCLKCLFTLCTCGTCPATQQTSDAKVQFCVEVGYIWTKSTENNYTHEQKKGNTLKLCYYTKTVFYCSIFFAYVENIANSLSKTALVFFLGVKITAQYGKEIKKYKNKSHKTSHLFLSMAWNELLSRLYRRSASCLVISVSHLLSPR